MPLSIVTRKSRSRKLYDVLKEKVDNLENELIVSIIPYSTLLFSKRQKFALIYPWMKFSFRTTTKPDPFFLSIPYVIASSQILIPSLGRKKSA